MKPPLRMTALLGAGFIRVLGNSWRISVVDEHHVTRARSLSRNLLFVFWHGRMLPLSYAYRELAIHVLASEHQDGELMGQVIRRLGFGHVRGSSTRGGFRAVRAMVAKVREGYDLGITVDGPRGPRYEVKPGPAEIAKLSGAAIAPVTTGSRDHWVFSSWDAFEMPKFFTDVQVRFGKPVIVSSGAGADELEAKRIEVQDILRAITEETDEELGKKR